MATTDYRPRFGKDIRIKPAAPVRAETRRPCGTPDCLGEGAYRVPKSRQHLNEYLWFCLQHAREHNEHWDYFSGMNEAEIAAFQIDAVTGHRPTWPLGKRAARTPGEQRFNGFGDAHGLFGHEFDGHGADEAREAPMRPLTPLQQRALDVLDLETGASLHQIKARYKELVKRFHPDTNGGDRGAEERLKRVIQAYGVLRASGLT